MLIGRAYVYGLAVAGEAGVAEVLDNLRAELDLTMALAGCGSLAEVGPETLERVLSGAARSRVLALVAALLAGCGEKPEPSASRVTAVTGTVDLERPAAAAPDAGTTAGHRAPATASTKRSTLRLHRPRRAGVEPGDAAPGRRRRRRRSQVGGGRRRSAPACASSSGARTASCSRAAPPA